MKKFKKGKKRYSDIGSPDRKTSIKNTGKSVKNARKAKKRNLKNRRKNSGKFPVLNFESIISKKIEFFYADSLQSNIGKRKI